MFNYGSDAKTVSRRISCPECGESETVRHKIEGRSSVTHRFEKCEACGHAETVPNRARMNGRSYRVRGVTVNGRDT